MKAKQLRKAYEELTGEVFLIRKQSYEYGYITFLEAYIKETMELRVFDMAAQVLKKK